LSKFITKKQVIDTAINSANTAGQKAGTAATNFIASKLTPKSQQILSKLTVPTRNVAPQVTTSVPQKFK